MNWRRILLLSIVLVSVLGIITWALLQNSEVATEFVRRQLQEVFATRASIGGTSINLEAGRLAIRDFELANPSNPDRNLVHIRKVSIDAQADLFGAGAQLRHVILEGLEFECGPTWPALTELLRTMPSDSAPTDLSGLDLPVVEVRSGKATVHLCDDERPLNCEQLQFTMVPLASDRNQLQLSGEVTLTEPAAQLTLTGELDRVTGAMRLALTTTEVDCTPQVVAYLTRLAKLDSKNTDFGGHIESLTLHCVVPATDASDRTPQLQLLAKCTDVHVNHPELPAIVKHAAITLFVDTSGVGTVRAEIEQNDDKGQLHLTTEVAGFMQTSNSGAESSDLSIEVRADGRNVAVDENSLAALRTFPIGNDLVDALNPIAGRGDIALYLKNPSGPDAIAEMDLSVRDGKMSFRGFGDERERIGFPLLLENASGRVILQGDDLWLRDMAANIPASAGGGNVSLQGHVALKEPSGEDTSLDIHGDDVAFTDELATALATLLRDDGELYNKLRPSGRADVRVVVLPSNNLPGSFLVEIKPNGAAMSWQGFPYQLDDLRGSIQVQKATAHFNITGRHGDGGLAMRGRIPLHAEHTTEEGFEAVITANQLLLDEDLLKGISEVVPELETQWRKAQPTGRVSGEIKVWRPQASDPLFHDVRLSLHNIDLLLPAAPWRATGLVGQVLVQGSGAAARIDFDALRGRLENENAQPAQLALIGHIESGPIAERDLAFVVRDLELCPQLGQTLDELRALDFATWSALKPSGRVDLVVRDRSSQAKGEDLAVVVQLVDVRSEAPMLPKPAEHMTGELLIEGGELKFEEVRGMLGETAVQCVNGLVRQLGPADGRTEITFQVHAKDMPIDDGFANLFSGPLQKAVRERQLRGLADVDGLALGFAVPTGDSTQPFATTINGTIGLDGLNMLLGTGRDGIRVTALHGLVTLAKSTVTDTGGQLTGTLERGSLSVFGHAFEAVEAAFTADAERLSIGTLKARIHSGELSNDNSGLPAITYDLPSATVPEGRLAANLDFDNIDVFALLSKSGWQNPPYSGIAKGSAALRHLDGNNVLSAEATGTLTVERADLGKVPLFKAIYAQLPAADQPRFNQLNVAYRLTKDAIVFDRLDVRSDIMAAKGQGKLDLDGYLDVKMELDNLLGQSADPLVMPLIEYLAQNLVSFRLYGHLRDLRASTQLVGASSPKRRPVLPMPPARANSSTPDY
jgi:hypothetical protein